MSAEEPNYQPVDPAAEIAKLDDQQLLFVLGASRPEPLASRIRTIATRLAALEAAVDVAWLEEEAREREVHELEHGTREGAKDAEQEIQEFRAAKRATLVALRAARAAPPEEPPQEPRGDDGGLLGDEGP